MPPKTRFKSPFQIILNVLAIVGILGVFGFFIWHTAAYMDWIFERPTPGDSRDYRDIAAAAVQFAVIIVVGNTVKGIRLPGQQPPDNPDGPR